MPGRLRQFRVLYRALLPRLIDLEVLSAQANAGALLVQFAAMLAAFSFVFSVWTLPQYVFSRLSRPELALAAAGDQEFLIATTMAIVGLFGILSWNAAFPDRRDVLVLGGLPVPVRLILGAKIAAIGAGLGISVVAINSVTGLWYPLATGGVRGLFAYWAVMLAAGLFVFATLLTIQGASALLLRYRAFLRVSNLLQLAAFFVILGTYFLAPGPSDLPLAPAARQALLERLPSYWYLALFQEMNGTPDPHFQALARRAVLGLLSSAASACVLFPIAHARIFRHVPEEPDVAPPAGARPFAALAAALSGALLRKSIDRAVVLFTGRTVLRSRQHRVLLAFYLGAGMAIALAYTRNFLYDPRLEQWSQPNVSLTAAGYTLVFCVLVGTRAVFSFPADLKANWMLQLTAVHSPRAYYAATRKAFLMIGAAPVLIGLSALYFGLWPAGPAGLQVMLMVAVGLMLATRLLIGFRKVPFTCSYLPGKSSLNVRLAAYGIGALTLIHMAALFSNGMLETTARTVVVGVVLAAMVFRAEKRWAEFAGGPWEQLQFEDAGTPEIMPLGLRRDGSFGSNLRYVDAAVESIKKPLRLRLRAALQLTAVTLATLAMGGAIYEQINERRDRIRYPQIGHSYDIGGRSLNLNCLGTGSPVVIFEGNQSTVGYAWDNIQRGVAKFTQACWYDRAGYGWSDPGPFPNHADSMARDLQSLLRKAGIAPPYVLAGHALGSFAVRAFAGYYPGDTAGLVLLDPLNEDTTIQVHNHTEALRPGVVLFARMMGRLGWWRLIAGSPGTPPRGWSADRWAEVWALRAQAKTVAARIGEPPLWISGEIARAARPSLRNLPLLVLSGEQQQEMVDGQDNQLELERHEELAHESRQGSHEVIAGSGYWNPFDTPEVVIDAVHRMVQMVR